MSRAKISLHAGNYMSCQEPLLSDRSWQSTSKRKSSLKPLSKIQHLVLKLFKINPSLRNHYSSKHDFTRAATVCYGINACLTAITGCSRVKTTRNVYITQNNLLVKSDSCFSPSPFWDSVSFWFNSSLLQITYANYFYRRNSNCSSHVKDANDCTHKNQLQVSFSYSKGSVQPKRNIPAIKHKLKFLATLKSFCSSQVFRHIGKTLAPKCLLINYCW